MFRAASFVTLLTVLGTTTALAQSEVTWWHGMGGHNGEVIDDVARKFNAAQTVCHLTPLSKGTCEEALAAGIAARGATIPAVDLLTDPGQRVPA